MSTNGVALGIRKIFIHCLVRGFCSKHLEIEVKIVAITISNGTLQTCYKIKIFSRETSVLYGKFQLRVIPTEKDMRLADPGSTKTPLCPTRGRSRFPERATIRPSAFLVDRPLFTNHSKCVSLKVMGILERLHVHQEHQAIVDAILGTPSRFVNIPKVFLWKRKASKKWQ